MATQEVMLSCLISSTARTYRADDGFGDMPGFMFIKVTES